MDRMTVGAILLGAVALAGCQRNAATGRSQLLLLSAKDSIALGEESKPALIEEYGGEVPSMELRGYVADVGESIAGRTEADNPQLPWEFTVLDSDVINAFALPGGKVFASRGLLERLDNEAELAGVLGHEIGHVTAQHVNERISQAMVIQGLAIGASAAAGSSDSQWAQVVPLIVGVGGQGYLLSFSRSQESEADRLGVRYMTATGYDPQGMVELLTVLKESATGPRPPQILSTHPEPEARITAVARLVAGPYAYTQGNSEFDLHRDRYQQQAVPHLQPSQAAGPVDHAWCGICRARARADTFLSGFVVAGRVDRYDIP